MLMSSKRNIKKEMFQPTTECVDSLTIDDVTGQAVPESGTGRKELSVSVLSVWIAMTCGWYSGYSVLLQVSGVYLRPVVVDVNA